MAQLSLKERLERLNALEKEMEKDYGTGIIVKDGEYHSIPRIPLSSPTLSWIMGGGGPRGRIMEVYGPESSGKTTLNTQFAVDVQMAGGYVVWVDAEHCFDPVYAHKFGLKTTPDCFKLIKPDCGEDALQIVIDYAKSGVVDFIVVDSVAALVPKAELEGDMDASQMGAQARMMSKAMRKLAGVASRSGTWISFINQIRMKIGVMFGSPETVPGGNALKYYASIRLDVRKTDTIAGEGGEEDDAIGIISKVTAKKNKTAAPFRKGNVEIYFDRGVDSFKEYIEFAVSFGILQKEKNTYLFDGAKVGVGLKQVTAFMRDNDGLYSLLKERVMAELNRAPVPKEEDIPEEDRIENEEGVSDEELAEIADEVSENDDELFEEDTTNKTRKKRAKKEK